MKKKDINFSQFDKKSIRLRDYNQRAPFPAENESYDPFPVIKQPNSSYSSRHGISCPNEHCFNFGGNAPLKKFYPSFSTESSEVFALVKLSEKKRKRITKILEGIESGEITSYTILSFSNPAFWFMVRLLPIFRKSQPLSDSLSDSKISNPFLSFLQKYIRENKPFNYKLRDYTSEIRSFNRTDEILKLIIFRVYVSKWSTNSIAKKYNFSPYTIARTRKLLNMALKERSSLLKISQSLVLGSFLSEIKKILVNVRDMERFKRLVSRKIKNFRQQHPVVFKSYHNAKPSRFQELLIQFIWEVYKEEPDLFLTAPKNPYNDLSNYDKGQTSKNIFIVKMSEPEILKFTNKHNLTLISNYKDIKNVNTKLKWRCNQCGDIIEDNLKNILRKKYKCANPKCVATQYEKRFQELIIINSKKFPRPDTIEKVARAIYFDIRESGGLDPLKLSKDHRNDPILYIPALFFLSFNHIKYNLNNYLNIKEFAGTFFPDKTRYLERAPQLYKFLSLELRKKIRYLPKRKLKLYSLEEYNIMIIDFIKMISSLFEYEGDYQDSAIELYFKLNLEHNLIDLFPKPFYLSATLILHFLSLNKEEYTMHSFVENLRNNNISVDKKDLSTYYEKFIKLISAKYKFKEVKIDSIKFIQELNDILEKYKKQNNEKLINIVKFILESFKNYHKTLEEFLIDLNFHGEKTPKRVLNRLSSGQNLLSTREGIIKFINNSSQIINFSSNKEYLRSLLNIIKVQSIESFEATKIHESLRRKERFEAYGENFYSPDFRIKKFIIMLGVSPYDGYDIWGNRSYSEYINRVRIYAQLHHIDGNAENDEEDNLVFIPTKKPEDSKKNVNYLHHGTISGYERNNNIKMLNFIKNRILKNSKIIEEAFFRNNSSLLGNLEGWNLSDIEVIKERLLDTSFLWTVNLENIIPVSSSKWSTPLGKRKRKDRVVKELLMKRKKVK